jgi:hypothetical protein
MQHLAKDTGSTMQIPGLKGHMTIRLDNGPRIERLDVDVLNRLFKQ